MKKLFAMILSLCLAAMLVPALAETDVTGTWYLFAASSQGVDMDVSGLGMSIEITLNADGTAEMHTTAYGQEISETATWTLEGSTLTLTESSGATSSLQLDDGRLVMDMGEAILYFSQEQPEAAPDVAAVAAESVNQFDGVWKISRVTMMGISATPEQAGYSSTATLTIADGKVVENGFDTEGNETVTEIPVEFKDGALVGVMNMQGLDFNIVIELLEDGTLRNAMSVTMEGVTLDMQMYYEPAEAAAEPAA